MNRDHHNHTAASFSLCESLNPGDAQPWMEGSEDTYTWTHHTRALKSVKMAVTFRRVDLKSCGWCAVSQDKFYCSVPNPQK